VSANLDLVRSIYADWERGDFSSRKWADPEIEYVQADGPEPGRWSGHANMAEGMRGWLSGWEEFRVEADEFRGRNGKLWRLRIYPTREDALEALGSRSEP
jgi:hypothetical protein